MAKYIIDAGGAWRRYHPWEVPSGWRMLGTIESESDHLTGALARSPAGLYAQINRDHVRMLDQRAVADALTRVKLTPYQRGKDWLLR
jgi:hypothetical protein